MSPEIISLVGSVVAVLGTSILGWRQLNKDSKIETIRLNQEESRLIFDQMEALIEAQSKQIIALDKKLTNKSTELRELTDLVNRLQNQLNLEKQKNEQLRQELNRTKQLVKRLTDHNKKLANRLDTKPFQGGEDVTPSGNG